MIYEGKPINKRVKKAVLSFPGRTKAECQKNVYAAEGKLVLDYAVCYHMQNCV